LLPNVDSLMFVLALGSAEPLHSILRKEEEKKEKIHIHIYTHLAEPIRLWIPRLTRLAKPRAAAEGVLGLCLEFSCLLCCLFV